MRGLQNQPLQESRCRSRPPNQSNQVREVLGDPGPAAGPRAPSAPWRGRAGTYSAPSLAFAIHPPGWELLRSLQESDLENIFEEFNNFHF